MRDSKKIFTLDEARKLLPKVKAVTEHYHDAVEDLQERLVDETSAKTRDDVADAIDREVRQWSRDVLALGVEPKGLWLCDFDSGDGFYFCWQLGEDDIEFIHGYESGFSGRRKIEWR